MQVEAVYNLFIMCDAVRIKGGGFKSPVVIKQPSGIVGSKHSLVVSLSNPEFNLRDRNCYESCVTLLLETIVTRPEGLFGV